MKKLVIIILVLLLAGAAYSQDGFDAIFDPIEDVSNEAKNRMVLGGEIGFTYGSYLDDNWVSERIILPFANLNLLLSSENVEAKVDLTIKNDDFDSSITMSDLIEELSLRAFFPFGYLDLGLLKTEWGKGDGIHVVDPLNPLDQSKGISQDLNQMKSSEIMVKMNFYIGETGLLELVYKPYFHSIDTAQTGRWMVKDLPALTVPPPDSETPAYTQAAARFTKTYGIFDLGGIFYYGFMGEPGFKITLPSSVELIYTKAMLLGLEAGWAIGPLTFRTEGGYWLSEDRDGTEAHLYNDRAVWLGGFDLMIPGTSLFVSVQEFGSYVMKFTNVNPYDVDLGKSYKENAITNTIIAAVEGAFYKDKMKLNLAGLYLFEANGYMILPTFIWNIEDDLKLSAAGQFFGGDDEGPNPYYAWGNNDNITLSLEYIF